MEDLLETIVGDLDDEHEEDNAVVTLADGVYEVGGDVPVNELEGLLGEDIFENADCDTIGGFITETLGRIPQAGETLPLDDRDDAELAVALESELETRELMAQVMALPPPDGELFLRRYVYGETAAQLGVHFNMPAATVRTRLHRARLALQKLLKEG